LGSLDHLEPIATAAGPVAVPVDWELIRLVWDPEGYPADAVYRNYHGRTVHDLRPWDYGGRPDRPWEAPVLVRRPAREFVELGAPRRAAHRGRRGGDAGAGACARTGRARAPGAPGQRLGLPGHARAGGRLPAGARACAFPGAGRCAGGSDRLRRRVGRRRAQPRAPGRAGSPLSTVDVDD